jgi:hypothetical protein
MKKRLVLPLAFSLLCLMAAVLAYLYFSGKEYVLRIPQNQIDAKMREKFPLSKSYLLLLRITLENPRLVLQENSDRIHVGLDAVLNITLEGNARPLSGSVDVSGSLRYAHEQGAFYLVSPTIEQASIAGIPEKFIERVNSTISVLLSEYYATHPVYTLNTADIKQAGAKMVLKNVKVENSELVITLGI